jgi:hypothetical protein
MQIKKIVTVVAATLLLTGAVVGGAAVASSRRASNADVKPRNHSVSKASGARSSTDSDTVKQGDQTDSGTPDTTETLDSESDDESGTGSGAESESNSDGQGGHRRPARQRRSSVRRRGVGGVNGGRPARAPAVVFMTRAA